MPLTAYRVGDTRFPLWSGTGAGLTGNRWNARGQDAIYAAGSYAGALLEHLVRLRLGKVPATYGSIVITLPDDVAVEVVDSSEVPGWDSADYEAGQAFAGPWFRDRRTAVLRVPSAVARPYEWNVVINPAHPDAARITHGPVVLVVWDERLFVDVR